MPVDGVTRGPAARTRRCAALFAAGVLLPLPLLAGCSSEGEDAAAAPVSHDVADAARAELSGRGTVRWAVDARPATLNAFHAKADAGTDRVAGAVLPMLFTLDARGRAVRNPDYLESAEVIDREPRQVVRYRLNPEAAWSDGRALGVADFRAQWRALRGRDRAYWTARNAGYERIERIAPGREPGEVEVTFRRPYADWRALFTPLYPKSVMGSPKAFNEDSGRQLPVSAGPFMPSRQGADRAERDRPDGRREGRGQDRHGRTADAEAPLTLVRDPRWWGDPARLDKLVLTPVPRAERAAALASGRLDVAEVDAATADRVAAAGGSGEASGLAGAGRPAGGAPAGAGPNAASGTTPELGAGRAAMVSAAGALRSWVIEYGPRRERAAAVRAVADERAAAARRAAEARALGAFTVRRSLAPAYTQLALNGTAGPLADERVRRAVARAIDREELTDAVFEPLGLSAKPLGSHLTMAGQHGYRDNSGALGGRDAAAARSLLADAGWQQGDGPLPRQSADAKRDADENGEADSGTDTGTDARPNTGVRTSAPADADAAADTDPATDTDPAAPDDAPDDAADRAGAAGAAGPVARVQGRDQPERDRPQGRAPAGDGSDRRGADRAGDAGPRALPGGAPVRIKDGRPLLLRFVLPSGPGTEQAREVGERIAAMLGRIGVQTDIVRVPDDEYFRTYVAKGDFDLALYSWPATAFPATDARPIFAKPRPAADGSLLVEQNYTRVGTHQIDQLFEQASTELDESAARELLQRADARIWAAAGSLPLYQRPQLIAARSSLANVGAFGLATPRYQDIGYAKSEDAKAERR
ncbi:ABC transporter family substrate-binding protein [Streptomyces sp. 71268]|uniref:ABC transporter family substrate-binding protein n=1 Tax=Streptomyces sp. 71268 TaxID=3002640 RepID=UPI0023F9A32A|nr:ABC transporter family substrate-binding protein [Streptomyces sp. 71268]WEV25609.1 ABC transporter family substrate-binding protein [Streptomyces sp. 71268]